MCSSVRLNKPLGSKVRHRHVCRNPPPLSPSSCGARVVFETRGTECTSALQQMLRVECQLWLEAPRVHVLVGGWSG